MIVWMYYAVVASMMTMIGNEGGIWVLGILIFPPSFFSDMAVWFTWSLIYAGCLRLMGMHLPSSTKRVFSGRATAALFILVLCMVLAPDSPPDSANWMSVERADIALIHPNVNNEIDNVRVFDSFVGDTANPLRVTMGPDYFADLTLISPDRVNPA